MNQSDTHVILVKRALVTDDHLSPSSLELYDLMHITNCDQAIDAWRPDWMRCPVCMASYDEDGLMAHLAREPD